MSSAVWVSGYNARDALNTLQASIYNNAAQALKAALSVTVQQAKQSTAWQNRTGALRSSIVAKQSDSFEGTVGAYARHAVFVEWGTRPHEIRPRNASILAFQVNGSTVFARKVNHPGTEPTKFMGAAADVGAQTLEWLLDEGLTKATSYG